jgi:glycosyltransferase involved in cell wall biosynthesis
VADLESTVEDPPTARSLSVVVPAWNEQDGVQRAVTEICAAGGALIDSGRLSTFELVVVDDGSTDATGDRLDALSVEHPQVRVVRHDRNRGVGAAMRTGIQASQHELVLCTDADLPVSMRELDRALDLLDQRPGVVAVVAYRLGGGTDGRRRRIKSLLWNVTVRRVLGLRVRDVNFAFKLLRGDEVRAVHLVSAGACIDAEILLRVTIGGGEIAEFGTPFQPRETGASSFASTRGAVDALRELARLRWSVRGSPSRTPSRRAGGHRC